MQPFESFHEQKEHAGPEAEQHDRNAGDDAPKCAKGRAAIAAAADDDVAGHGDEEFEDAAAQEPAEAAFEQRVRIVGFGEAAKDDRPDDPKSQPGDDGPKFG